MTAELITAMLQVIEDLTAELAAVNAWREVTPDWPPDGVPVVARLHGGRYVIGKRHGAGLFTDRGRVDMARVEVAAVLP
jgi:hypothetical protein